jgi:hypothetical protein
MASRNTSISCPPNRLASLMLAPPRLMASSPGRAS